MFESLTYKQKFVALLIATLALSGAAYKRSFSVLGDLLSENEKLKQAVVDDLNFQDGLQDLGQDLKMLDGQLGLQNLPKEQILQSYIKVIGQHENIEIFNIPEYHQSERENHRTITNFIEITGSLNNLLRLVYRLETEVSLSRIVSLHFYTIKAKDKSLRLHLKITFQNYEKIK